ncbi:MAG: hypothetical protein ACLS31_00880, partial [Oscillospiraceae bacterium]
SRVSSTVTSSNLYADIHRVYRVICTPFFYVLPPLAGVKTAFVTAPMKKGHYRKWQCPFVITV